MKDSKRFFIFSLFFALGLSLITIGICFPIRNNEFGTVIDWIGNDNGFGIKLLYLGHVNTYWLDYSGRYWLNNLQLPQIINHYIEIVYDYTLFNPNGVCGISYLHCISLNVLR